MEPETVIGKDVGEILTNAEYDSRDYHSYGFLNLATKTLFELTNTKALPLKIRYTINQH